MFSDMNVDTMLSTFTIAGHSTKNPTSNKTTEINIILKHTFPTAEYSDSVTSRLSVLLLYKHHAMITPLIRTPYPVMIL